MRPTNKLYVVLYSDSTIGIPTKEVAERTLKRARNWQREFARRGLPYNKKIFLYERKAVILPLGF